MNDSTQAAPRWSISTMLRIATGADLPTASMRFAALGIPVFPCVPGGKQPLTPNGFHDATASTAVVEQWWRRTPEANIGLPTGARSGVLVVDVDTHRGGSGFEAFERARAADLGNGWGWLVRTPSGGLHAYYPLTDGVEQRSWQVPSAHVDFRGDGGYVIAPPSRFEVAGRPTAYEVIAVAQHHPCPLDAPRLREFLDPPRTIPVPGSGPSLDRRPADLAAWVASRPEGARNQGLFWAACRMVEGGHPYDTTVSMLGDAARSAGLPEREARTTIRSAYRRASHRSVPTRPGPMETVEAVRL